MTRQITSISQIRNTSGRVYVRWSKSIALDSKRGHSLRYGSQAEAGLSACEIDKTWEDWRILRQIQEYQFTGSGSCWLVTGTEVGKGGDNEPLLADVVVIGKVSADLVSADYLKMWRDAEIAKRTQLLSRSTDAFARQGAQRDLDRLQADDRRTWQRMMYGQ